MLQAVKEVLQDKINKELTKSLQDLEPEASPTHTPAASWLLELV